MTKPYRPSNGSEPLREEIQRLREAIQRHISATIGDKDGFVSGERSDITLALLDRALSDSTERSEYDGGEGCNDPDTFDPIIPGGIYYVPPPVTTSVYGLRIDHGEVYHSLGLFPSLQHLRNVVASYDGRDGGPIAECMDDGETLDVLEHKLGEVDSCGCGGTTVMRLRRAPVLVDVEEDPDEPTVWTTEEIDP